MADKVNHPKHYNAHPSGIECIDVVEHMNFNLGNAVKYIWRADHKSGLEDLKKAAWYIAREIERLSSKPVQVNYPYAHEDCPGRPFVGPNGLGCSLCGVAHGKEEDAPAPTMGWWCSYCQKFVSGFDLKPYKNIHTSCGSPVSLMPFAAAKIRETV